MVQKTEFSTIHIIELLHRKISHKGAEQKEAINSRKGAETQRSKELSGFAGKIKKL